MEQIKWQRIRGRRMCLQKSIQTAYGAGYLFSKLFGTKTIPKQLYYFDGRTTHFYFPEDEYNDFLASLRKKLNDIGFVKGYKNKVTLIFEESLRRAKKMIRSINKNIDRKEILSSFVNFDNLWNHFTPAAWSLFYLTNLEPIVEGSLRNIVGNADKIKEYIKIIAHPKYITPIVACEIDILKLAEDLRNNKKNIRDKAEKLNNKYGWMPVFNFDDEPRNADYYIEEAERILDSRINIERKLKESKKKHLENEKKYKLLLRRIKNPLLREQIELMHIAGYIRDKREEIRNKVTLFAGNLYYHIAQEIDLSVSEVINLNNREIKKALLYKSSRAHIKRTAQQRQKQFMFFLNNKSLQIIDDKQQIKEIFRSIRLEDETDVLSGQVAYKQEGVVQGNVKIVFSSKEVDKVKSGDILVATMTKPDFVGAIKKAAAFITDEGGVTCHAAIIARELKKPCIVGTKIATQILKDGDLVEVDSSKNIIKRIKVITIKK